MSSSWSAPLFLLSAIAVTASANAQGMIPSAISATIAQAANQSYETCLAPSWEGNPKRLEKFQREAGPALQKYIALVRASKNPGPAFKRRPIRSWFLDGTEVKKFDQIIDPWAARTTRFEESNLELAKGGIFGRAVWRAYGEDGAFLGMYDAKLVIASEGFRLVSLKLWSPEKVDQASSPFEPCPEPEGRQKD